VKKNTLGFYIVDMVDLQDKVKSALDSSEKALGLEKKIDWFGFPDPIFLRPKKQQQNSTSSTLIKFTASI